MEKSSGKGNKKLAQATSLPETVKCCILFRAIWEGPNVDSPKKQQRSGAHLHETEVGEGQTLAKVR